MSEYSEQIPDHEKVREIVTVSTFGGWEGVEYNL